MVFIKNQNEILLMQAGGKRVAKILAELISLCQVGVSSMQIEKQAMNRILKAGGKPAFKNYGGYPAATCISVNDEVVHSPPRLDKIFQEGDVVSIDIGLKYKGMYTDTARTIGIGAIGEKEKKLIDVTRKALDFGIRAAKFGNRIGDISWSIQSFVEKNGFGVIRSLVGHGVGKQVHEDPRVPNFGEKGKGVQLKPGMTLALEPMVTLGNYEVFTDADGWTIKTLDKSLAAHFEDTILITRDGCEILTR